MNFAIIMTLVYMAYTLCQCVSKKCANFETV